VPELIQSRTDRRGTELTFRYDTLGGRKVAGSSLNMGVGASPIVLTITPQQSFGLKRAVAPAAAFTLIDGPRTDSADVTKVWQDRLGQPALIENAHGFTTGLRRDATWPALVAEVVHANGWRVTATYDLRGNVASTTDHGIGGSPTTTYEWDQKWDALTKIKQPEGDSVVMMYDAATGNRLWQQDGRGSATRVNFGYNSANQLITIAVPGTPAESIGYQPFALGNVEWTKTPKKFDTRYTQDDIGRITQVDSRLDTLVNSPPSCGCWIYRTTLTYHDIMDRDSIQVGIGPQDLALGASPETLFVRNFYNANGQLDSLWRWSSPDPASIDTIRTEWRYDAPGRVVAEVAPDGYKDSTVYDPAGNADTLVTRRGHVITMVYDALNRLVSRSLPQVNYPSRPTNFHIQSPKVISAYSPYTIPAETHTFTYDALGRLLTADNADAKVKRAYLPNGLLDTDSLWIQTVNRDDWNKHVYGLRSTYDRDGRRLVLAIPQQLAASGATTISYVYDRGLGALQTAYDLQGARYDFSYNARGELNSLTYPSQYGEVFHYDSDGRLSADTLRNTGGTAFPRIEFALVRASNYAYDARDLVLWSGDPVFFKDTLRATYSGLGHLLKSQLIQHGHYIGVSETGVTNSPARYTTVEQYALDALVNRTQGVTRDTLTTSSGYWTSSLSNITSTYERGTGRLLTDRSVSVRTNYSYDSAGSVVLTSNMGDIAVQSPAEERASFFAADGSLRAVDSRWAAGQSASILSVQKYTFEEYRYDALGRRIWLRAQKWCNDVAPMDVMQATDCRTSPLRRTIWDGNQELAEIQMPWGLQSPSGYTISTTPTWWENDINPVSLGTLYTNQGTGDANPYFGHVVYTAGRGIDQPVAITRVNYVMALDLVSRQPYSHVQAPFTIMPFWNARGDAPGGVFSNGAGALCDPPTSQTACVGIKWPWTWSAYDRQLALARIAWHGTLLESRRDHSGLGYMRNRYYDPKSGRFTQEDPLGLAGGLNLYGFAGGDPVNFSDPFGLCKEGDTDCERFVRAWEALGWGAGFLVGGGSGLIEAGASGGVLAPVAVAQTAAATAAGGVGGRVLGEALWSLLSFMSSQGGEGAESGAKSVEQYEKHTANLERLRERLGQLTEDLGRAKGPKAQRPIREAIDRLKEFIKGHEKEIRQKWSEGRPE